MKLAETENEYKRAERFMAAIYVQQGRYEEAFKIYNKHCKTWEDPLRCHGSLAYVYAKAGRRDEALLELQKVKDAIDTGPKHRFLAGIYSELGDNDQALAHLEVDDYENGLLWCFFKFDPCIARVRSDPRFSALLERRFGTQP
jgi:tetratricopeptide (TPR) repeat protein